MSRQTFLAVALLSQTQPAASTHPGGQAFLLGDQPICPSCRPSPAGSLGSPSAVLNVLHLRPPSAGFCFATGMANPLSPLFISLPSPTLSKFPEPLSESNSATPWQTCVHPSSPLSPVDFLKRPRLHTPPSVQMPLGQVGPRLASLPTFTTVRSSCVGLQLFLLRSVNSPRDGLCLIHPTFVVHLVQYRALNIFSLFIELKLNR